MPVEDKQGKALEYYGVKAKSRYRTRGAFVYETERGLILLREHDYIGNHFAFENKIKKMLGEAGMTQIDQVIPTQSGEDYVTLESGEKFVATKWFSGEECNLHEVTAVSRAAENLGRMHRILRDFEEGEEYLREAEDIRVIRRTREMRRVNHYMKEKKMRNEFEIFAMDCFSGFYQEACEAEDILNGISCCERDICHGDYNYHNILCTPQGVATTSFTKACRGEPLMDLYYFLRKTMEKNNWEDLIGMAVIEGYCKEVSLSKSGILLLYALLRYPEKYWKLLNQYYNRKKSWISNRYIEKLLGVREQKSERERFLMALKARC